MTGDDEADLRAAAEQVETMLSTTPGLIDVTSDLSDQRPLLRVDVDRRKAARLGFTQAEVGQAIANALRGTEVGTVVLEGESRDIMVRPQEADEASPEQIAALELPVSQLQQQQAVDRATDELEDKQDALTEEGDELTEDGEDLADRQEDLGDRQAGAAEEQQDKAVEAAADQRAELRRGPARSPRQLAESRRARQPTAAGVAEPRPAARAAQAAPDRPARLTQAPARRPSSSQARRARREPWQQVAQLRVGGRPGRGPGRAAGRAARRGAVEQADESADQRAQQEEFTDEQEALGDEQKALGDEQEELADEQSDLAEEQSDIADIRARPIQVSDVAKVRQELAPSTVTQIDGIRAVTLTATPDTDDLGALTQTVQTQLDALLDLPAGVDDRPGRRQRRPGRGVPRAGRGHAAGHRAGVPDHGGDVPQPGPAADPADLDPVRRHRRA